MSLLPESGKPIDLDRDQIKSREDADIVLNWLDNLITSMQLQIIQHLVQERARDIDDDWLGRCKSALRATIHTRFGVAEQRKKLG